MAVSQSDFKTIHSSLNLDISKKVSHMDVVLEVNDVAGAPIYITDIMLQGGTVATSWVGHVSEIRWSFDNA